jgi:hypothetical protein
MGMKNKRNMRYTISFFTYLQLLYIEIQLREIFK